MNLIDRCIHSIEQQKPTLFRFLSLSDQQALQSIAKKKIQFYGGYEEAEYKRAFLLQNIDASTITCFHITYDERYVTLTHQNILGTLLSLSIARDAIGDILPKQAVFFVVSELQEEIKRSFTSISRVPITLNIIDGRIVHSEQEYSYHRTTISSSRLDSIVSSIANISRKQATEMIQNELVKVNHTIDNKPTRQIKEATILSIRRVGRFEIQDMSGRSRKGKIIVKYRKFV